MGSASGAEVRGAATSWAAASSVVPATGTGEVAMTGAVGAAAGATGATGAGAAVTVTVTGGGTTGFLIGLFVGAAVGVGSTGFASEANATVSGSGTLKASVEAPLESQNAAVPSCCM